MIPIKDENGAVIAVLGLDYSAEGWNTRLWNQMIPDILIVACILMLVVALLYSGTQSARLNALSEKLALDEALYHNIFNQAPVGIAIVSDKNFVTRSKFGNSNINPMFERILGRTCGDLEVVDWPQITYPEDVKTDLEHFERFKSGEIDGYSMEKRFIKPDGSVVWTNMNISHLFEDPAHNPLHLCLLEDISARKEAEETLRESERSKSVFLSNLPGMAYRCNYDRERTMLFVSDGCYDLTGYAPEQLLHNRNLSFNDIIALEYRELLWEEWIRILALKLPFRYEYEITTAAGDRKWVLEMGQGVYGEHGEVGALEGIILDVSASKEIENIFRYNSEHDIWTGLHNRRYLVNLLKKDAKSRSAKTRAVISINLSAVRQLSLTYGFQYSQETIKRAAQALDALSSDRRQLFSTYENRFVFYVKGYPDKDDLTAFCEEIAGALRTVLLEERIGGGIGVLEIDDENKHDVDEMLKNLLVASEKAIRVGEADIAVCFFDKEMQERIDREEKLSQELSQIAAGQRVDRLFLLYQPILDLQTHCICGFEALARLNSDKYGLVSPLEFIPLAEKTNLIVPLGHEIIRQAFQFSNRLKENGCENIDVSINISAIQLLKNDFTENFLALTDEMQVNPSNIGLEITESIFASNYEEINRILGELKEHGIHVAIDDFGTGYSSLARERELNVNCLKIDRHFINNLIENSPGELITGDIISMAHKLGHCTIAEGVEHESQLQYLKEHGCDKAQGFLIGKPLAEEAAFVILKNQAAFTSCCAAKPAVQEPKTETFEVYQDRLKLILDSTAEAIYGIDRDGVCTFCNLACVKLLGYEHSEQLLGKQMHRLIHHSRRDHTPIKIEECKIYQAFRQGKGFEADDEVFWRADGTFIEVEYHSYPQMRGGEAIGAVVNFTDITDKKQKEAKIQYLNYHDVLTGLYNRRYMDENRERVDVADNLPLSVIFADINGLKLTNDIFGHTAGDELIKKFAEIIRQSRRENDIAARAGGDEFLLLLPKTDRQAAEKILAQIKSGFSKSRVEAVKCSVSIGSDTKTGAQQSLDIVIANAENAMYKDKTMNRETINRDMIDTILETLHTRSPKERRHSMAVSKLCGDVGAALRLPEPEIDKLKRIGYLHDIGKIILDQTILNKEILTEEESEKVKQHPAVGYRILNLFDDTLDLAEFIYGHHERWDGSGFPRGLKGEQIPLISRILLIAETFERVLSKNTIPVQERKQAALEVIRKNTGTRFDPQIADVFIRMMNEQTEN